MNQHPYLRAYMAGIVVPTFVLLLAMTAFTIARYAFAVPLSIERVIVFPLTAVPNLWGMWNIIYVALLSRRGISIGAFGALLPLLLVPGGLAVARLTGFQLPLPRVGPLFVIVVGAVVYYLVWKHIVGRLNAIVGVA